MFTVNFIYNIYMAEAKAFNLKSLNYQDIFNEIFVTFSLYWKFIYTGVILN